MEMKCERCVHSVMDYEEYFGGARQWFVEDCKKGHDPEPEEGCEDFEEVEDFYPEESDLITLTADVIREN